MLWSRALRASTAAATAAPPVPANGGRVAPFAKRGGARRPVSTYRLLSLRLLGDEFDSLVSSSGQNMDSDRSHDKGEDEETEPGAALTPKDGASARKPLDWNQEKYVNICARLGITPSQKFLQSLLHPTVQLSRLFLGTSGAFACSLGLRNNAHLRVLVLEDNELGCSGAKHLTTVIRDNPFMLELRLVSNHIGIEGLLALIEALIENRTVKILDLSGNRFEEKCGTLMRKLLDENDTIRELYLGHNNFRESGIVQISYGLAYNRTLRLIDLSWNHIRREGAISLCDSLRLNTSLRTALLGWNGLYTEGCRSLAKSLPENSSLQTLDISCNRIDIKCLEFLIKGLKGNSTLKCLRISQNPLTAENICALLMKIEELRLKIEELDVTGLTVDPQSLTISERISASRKFSIVFGVLLKQQSKADDDEVFLNDDPMMVLMEFMKMKNMRLLDLFLHLDSDGSKSLTHKQFKEGLMAIGVPMSPLSLQRLLRVLDKDGDGEVDYSELMAGQREHRRRMMRVQVQERSVPYEETELGIINAKLRRVLANRERAAKEARGVAATAALQHQDAHSRPAAQQHHQESNSRPASQAGPRMLDVAVRAFKSGSGAGMPGLRVKERSC